MQACLGDRVAQATVERGPIPLPIQARIVAAVTDGGAPDAAMLETLRGVLEPRELDAVLLMLWRMERGNGQ